MSRFFRHSNPALKNNTFSGPATRSHQNTMTIGGTSIKTIYFLTVLIISAFWSWHNITQFFPTTQSVDILFWILLITTFLFALLTYKFRKMAFLFGALYCVSKGVMIGFISLRFEASFPGIVTQSFVTSFATLLSMLIIYGLGLIKVSRNFRIGVITATGAIGILYLISFIGRIFGFSIPFLHDASPISIAISIFIVILAVANLLLDFDVIERGVSRGAPKYMEWTASFGLIVTLIWMYVSILRLLNRLNRRRY